MKFAVITFDFDNVGTIKGPFFDKRDADRYIEDFVQEDRNIMHAFVIEGLPD